LIAEEFPFVIFIFALKLGKYFYAGGDRYEGEFKDMIFNG